MSLTYHKIHLFLVLCFIDEKLMFKGVEFTTGLVV